LEGLAGILGEPGTGCLTRATGCEGRAQTSSDQPAHSWSGGFFDFRFRFTTTTTTAAAAAAAATMMTFIGPPSGARSIRRIGSSRNEPDGRAARKENDTLWLSRKRLKVHEEEAKRLRTSGLQRLQPDLPGWQRPHVRGEGLVEQRARTTLA